MQKVLGIDLGTNSLGWGIVESNTVKDCGVLVFEQGIPQEKGREAALSPAAERTAFRAARRLKFRRRLRKYHTLKILIAQGMCPLALDELNRWIRQGVFPRGNENFIHWLNSTKERNPYYFRAHAATEKIPLPDLGRAFFHIALRRGFKSSKKDQEKEDSPEMQSSEMKGKIRELKLKLESSGITLGQYLYERFQCEKKIRKEIRCGRKEHYEPEFERICDVQGIDPEVRKALHTAIFMQRPLRSQKHRVGKCPLEKHHSRCLISHPLFERYRMLSFINSIKVKNVGDKEFRFLTDAERRLAETVFMVSAPSFKVERILHKLFPEIGKKNYEGPQPEMNYRPDHTVASASVTHQLSKILKCNDLFAWRHSYVTRHGKEAVMDVQALFDGLYYFSHIYDEDDDDKAALKFASERVGLSEDAAAALIKIKIPDGYARYSLCAIRKIMPFLEMGYVERHAVFLAKLPDIMGECFENRKEELLHDFQQCVNDYVWEKENLSRREHVQGRLLSLTERLRNMLEEKWKIMPPEFEKLYSYQENSNYQDCSKEGILPRIELGMIYNPVVHRSLTVLRHLVNHLRRCGKIDADTEIHVELTREVNDKNHRLAYLDWQKKNEGERAQAVKAFEEYGISNPTETQILRWCLWEEQGHRCLYTGRKIEAGEIFSPTADSVDIEHTIPRSRGGDNSRENLTLCDSQFNRHEKVGKLPSECDNYHQPNGILENLKSCILPKLEEAEVVYSKASAAARKATGIQRAYARKKMLYLRFALDYWRTKVKTFKLAADEINEDFTLRQLSATGVMTRHALQFLKSVYSRVFANSGKITKFARESWGVQNQDEAKDRSDHIHHAVDAIVVAALNRKTLARISAAYHECEELMQGRGALKIAYPWESFPEDVRNAVNQILVRHIVQRNEMKQTKRNGVFLTSPVKLSDGRVIRRVPAAGDTVRGALHNQTWYGCIRQNGAEKFVVRKPFDSNEFKQLKDLEKIVDPGVKNALLEQIRNSGMDFKTAMQQEFRMKTKTGKFDGPVIRRVRIFCSMQEPLKIKEQTYCSEKAYKNYYYAETAKGSNFMVALYRKPEIPGTEKTYEYRLISLWNWAKEHRQSGFVPYERREKNLDFIGFIAPGTMALFYEKSPEELHGLPKSELQKRLYTITAFEKDGERLRLHLRWHREAREKGKAAEAMEIMQMKSSVVSYDIPAFLLRISQKSYQNHLLFDGIDFEFTADGEIIFRE